MQEQALSDVKVLDLTWYISGPCCTRLLADYGADVIKVERPGEGDPARRMGPFLGDDPHLEKSGLFLHLNNNKRSITLNLKSQTGKKIFEELVKDVDILVESFSPRVMPSLGLSYEELEKINPKLVMTSVSNFGQSGPYRDYKASDLIIYGMGGAMYSNGLPDREPLKKGERITEYQGGYHAAAATMMAFLAARTQGVGQHVDVSLLEMQLGTVDRRMGQLLAYQYNGEVTPRTDPRVQLKYPFGIHPCKDGYWDILGYPPYMDRTARMMGMPELAQDQRFKDLAAQRQPGHHDEWQALFISWCMEHTKREILTRGQEAGVMCGVVNTTEDLVNDPHWRAREFWVEMEHPVAGKLTYTGAPFRAETPWRLSRPAPLLGQHNEEVYGALGYTRDDLVKLRGQGVI